MKKQKEVYDPSGLKYENPEAYKVVRKLWLEVQAIIYADIELRKQKQKQGGE